MLSYNGSNTRMSRQSSLREVFSGLDARVVLQDIIGAHNLTENGDEYIHSCPLPFGMHRNGDQSPSASLNRETLLFNCFTCGGGSVIWLVQNCLNVSREEAINILKNEVSGLKIVPIEDFIEKLEEVFSNAEEKSIEITYYSENILKRWEGPCDYLTNRGVSIEMQKEMRTGVETGKLEVARTSQGESVVSVDRVVLPHFIKGRLSGWVARKIHNVEGIPKYRNSKGFPRGHWLYNLDKAKEYDEVYVVESPMSVLVMKSRGIQNVVATFGAKVDNHQMELLRNFNHVIAFMDGDIPGWNATSHLAEELRRYTKISVIDTPDDEDPATLDSIPELMGALTWQLQNKI